MDLNEALTYEFKAISILSNSVFPIVAPQGTKAPYLTYTQGQSTNNITLSGESALKDSEHQINYYQPNFSSLMALKKLLMDKLKSFSLRVIGVDGPYIQEIEIFNDFEAYENQVPMYKGIIEIRIHIKEE